MEHPDKKCGKRASATIFSKNELVEMVMVRLGITRAAAERMDKKALCRELGIEWPGDHPPPEAPLSLLQAPPVIRHCTSMRGKRFPNRYTKEELVEMIRARNPFINRTRYMRYSFKILCRMARVPFTAPPPPPGGEKGSPEVNRNRFYKDEDGAVPGGPDVAECLERGNRPPFGYQERVVRHLRNHRGLIAIHSLGSGKTLTALFASQCYLDEHPTHKVVVISPATLIENFKKEMRAFGDLRHADRYEFFSFEGFYSAYKDRLRPCRNTFLIIDEAHNLRTEYKRSEKTGKETGKQCGVITKCAEKASRILLLTATPIINKAGDIASLLNMVRDHPTADNRILTKDIQLAVAENNEAFLREKGMCRFSFYQRASASEDYPRSEEEDVYLAMPPRFYQMYNKVQNEMAEDEEVLRTFGSETKLKSFYNGIRRAVNILSELPEEEMLKSPKIKWILQKLRDEPGQKTVVFSNFLDHGLKGLQNRMPAHLRTGMITGKQSKQQRADTVRRYNDDEIDILFLSKAGSEGIDLKGTRRIILLESGWNENSEKQVIGRGVRYRSHAHLPPDQRKVKIFRLFHVKPSERNHIEEILSEEYADFDRKEPTTWPSADLLLKRISLHKQRKIDAFTEMLKRFSIERNACDASPQKEEQTLSPSPSNKQKQPQKQKQQQNADTLKQAVDRLKNMRILTADDYRALSGAVNALEQRILRHNQQEIAPLPSPEAFLRSPGFNWKEVVREICPNRKCQILLNDYLDTYPLPIYPLHRRLVGLVINNRSRGGNSIFPFLDLMIQRLRATYTAETGHAFPELEE